MAITKITKIKTTPQLALAYAMRDKQQEYISENEINESSPHEIWYDEKTGKSFIKYFTLSSFLNCGPLNPYSDFAERQKQFQGVRYKGSAKKYKDGLEPLMYHLKQSFNGAEADCATANEIGRRLAEELFSEYIVVVSTHGNTDNIHNHIMISAWNEDGRKLNYNKALTNQIREVSDRLCEEYGLSILENTRSMKLSTYTDKDGNTHSIEMTDRKRRLMEERKEGFAARDNVGSYRNSSSYQQRENRKKSNRKFITDDIDMLLPKVKSYEELISELRKLGYIVNAKKKNGEWLSHVSFKAPHQSKATRDSSLSGDGFYERGNLTMYIDSLRNEIERQDNERRYSKKEEDESLELPVVEYFDSYEYGKTDINKVNEKYRVVVDKKTGEHITVPRSEYEQKIIMSLKESYKALQNDKRTYIRTQKRGTLTPDERARIINRIVNTWNSLTYCEQHNIYSYSQMFDIYRENKDRGFTAAERLKALEKDAVTLNENYALYQRLGSLRETMENHRGNFEYAFYQYPKDKRRYDEVSYELTKRGFETPEQRKSLADNLTALQQKEREYNDIIADSKYQMKELENCFRTLTRIDREAGFDTISIECEFDRLCGNVRTENDRER